MGGGGGGVSEQVERGRELGGCRLTMYINTLPNRPPPMAQNKGSGELEGWGRRTEVLEW